MTILSDEDTTFSQVFLGGREEIGIVPNGDTDEPSGQISIQYICRKCP
jgi:hypothetical protein